MRNFLIQNGFSLLQEGNGLNYFFNDGEKTVSQYELDFSNFLRENSLCFNVDYFRDVKYSTFDNKYTGNMNCDYLIKINNHNIYVELAGLLGNKSHEVSFINNQFINSKSKEKYRLKLNEKRNILERNNLNYYILLKSDMNLDTYINILNKYREVG